MTPAGPGRSPAVLIATLFGAGRSPVAPGTAGTLATVPVAILLARLLPPWGFAAAAAGLAFLGVWAAGEAARRMAVKDPGPVVIDEAAGYLVTLLYLPAGWSQFLLGFVLFRFMDVVKPPPARRAEGLPGGWGIVADDLIAGAYANLALRAIGAIASWIG